MKVSQLPGSSFTQDTTKLTSVYAEEQNSSKYVTMPIRSLMPPTPVAITTYLGYATQVYSIQTNNVQSSAFTADTKYSTRPPLPSFYLFGINSTDITRAGAATNQFQFQVFSNRYKMDMQELLKHHDKENQQKAFLVLCELYRYEILVDPMQKIKHVVVCQEDNSLVITLAGSNRRLTFNYEEEKNESFWIYIAGRKKATVVDGSPYDYSIKDRLNRMLPEFYMQPVPSKTIPKRIIWGREGKGR